MTTLPDREVWRRLDAALALLGIEPAQNQKAMNAMSAARLILAAGEAAMSPDTRHTANESQATILQTVRLPMVGDFAEAMARFQKDNPELMSLDVAVAFILGSYLTDADIHIHILLDRCRRSLADPDPLRRVFLFCCYKYSLHAFSFLT